jgi:hypothetical protein
MSGRTRAVAKPRWEESDLIKSGFIKHINTLGVIYYSNPDDSDFDWIKDASGPYWHQVPWELVENPYQNQNDPTPTRETATGQQGREITATAMGARIAGLYGEILVGGDVFFQKLINNTYALGYGLGHGEMESCQAMFAAIFGQDKYPFLVPNVAGFYQTEFHNGAVNQAASQILATARGLTFGNTPIHPALAYIAALYLFDANNMPDVPEPKFLIRGRKCYDPRLDVSFVSLGVPTRNATTVVWTRNPALILADYLYNTWFGLGLNDDGLDWATVSSAATYCDVIVGGDSVCDVVITDKGQYSNATAPIVTFTAAPGGGRTATGIAIMQQQASRDGGSWYVAGVSITDPGFGYIVTPSCTFSGGTAVITATATSARGEKRHMMDLAIRRETTHKSNIDTMRQQFRCTLIERQGRIAFSIDQAKASAYTFTKDTSRAISGNRKGTSKVPTASIYTFTNPKKDWVQDKVTTYTDNCQKGVEEYRPVEWTFEGTTRTSEAFRNNSYLLGKQRSNLGNQVELVTTDGHQLEKGDRVTIDLSIVNPGSIIDFTLDTVKDNGNGRFLCDVSYYNPAIFTDTVSVVEGNVPLTTVDPYGSLAAPTGLTITEQVDEFVPGVYTPKLLIGFTPVGGPYYGGTVCKYTVNGGTVREVPAISTGPFIIPIPEGPGAAVVLDLYSKNVLSGALGTASLHGTYTMYNPNSPEPIGYVTYDGTSNGVYWDKPKSRSYVTTSGWTVISGCTGLDTTKIDDGNYAVNAVTFPATTNCELRFTAGGPINEVTITLAAAEAAMGNFTLEYFTGSVWTAPTTHFCERGNPTNVVWTWFMPAAIGIAGTLWRFKTDNGYSVSHNFTEVDAVVYGSVNPYVKGYSLTGYDDKGALYTKFIDYTPTLAKPVKMDEFTYKRYLYRAQSNETFLQSTQALLKVQTVTPTNIPSITGDNYSAFSTGLPANSDFPTVLGAGTSVSSSPAAADDSTVIATTSWARRMQGLFKVIATAFNTGIQVDGNTSPSMFITVGGAFRTFWGVATGSAQYCNDALSGDVVLRADVGTLRMVGGGSGQSGLQVTSTGVGIMGGTEIKKHISSTASFSSVTVNNSASNSATYTIVGASLGDVVLASINQDLQGLAISAYVVNSNSVVVVLSNLTGVNVTLSSGTVRVDVWKH